MNRNRWQLSAGFSTCSLNLVKIHILDECNLWGYIESMIKSFRHKGLKDYYYSGRKKGIRTDHEKKLGRILDRLDASVNVEDMALPNFKLHKLSGKEKDTWSVWVNGNWRVTYFFENGDAYVVDYREYH